MPPTLPVTVLIRARDYAVHWSVVRNVCDGVPQLYVYPIREPTDDRTIAVSHHRMLTSEEAVVIVLVPANRAQSREGEERNGE